MTLEEFKHIQKVDTLSLPLQALWYDGRGDWVKAHELAQAGASPQGDWVHAYLHRKEGDAMNADYWYRRAGRRRTADTLEEEWTEIVTTLLKEAKN